MPVYFLTRERKVQMEGEEGRNWEELEEGNRKQNILIKKNLLSMKEKYKRNFWEHPQTPTYTVCSHLPNILEISEMWKRTQKIKHRKPNKAEHSGMHSTSHQETQNLDSRLSYWRACLYRQRTMEAE